MHKVAAAATSAVDHPNINLAALSVHLPPPPTAFPPSPPDFLLLFLLPKLLATLSLVVQYPRPPAGHQRKCYLAFFRLWKKRLLISVWLRNVSVNRFLHKIFKVKSWGKYTKILPTNSLKGTLLGNYLIRQSYGSESSQLETYLLRKGTNTRKNKTLNTIFLRSLNFILYQGARTWRAFGDRKRIAQGFRRACI